MKIFRHTPGTLTAPGFFGILSTMIRKNPRLNDSSCTTICYEDICRALSVFGGEITDEDCHELIEILREFKGEDFLIEPITQGCPSMRINKASQISTALAIKAGVDAVKCDEPWIREQGVAVME